MKTLQKIILAIIVMIALIFAAQNFDIVAISFFNWEIDLPVAVVVFGIYVLGAISGGLLLSILKKVASMGQAKKRKDQNENVY